MELSELTAGRPIRLYTRAGNPALCVGRLTERSGQADEQSVFAAVEGARFCGADFAADAYRRGARCFLCSRPLDLPADAVFLLTDDVRAEMGFLTARLLGNPERKMCCIAVTGTKGKTTVCTLLAALLRGCGFPTLCVGTGGVSGIPWEHGLENTTPAAEVLFRIFAKAANAGVRYAVVEVSSQALKQKRVEAIPFACAVFTALGVDHIDPREHPDFADYIAAKRRLFTSFDIRFAVADAEEPFSDYMLSGITNIVKTGIKSKAEYGFYIERATKKEISFFCRGIRFSLPMPGEFNARDAMLAIATAKALTGRPLSDFVAPLALCGVEGRSGIRKLHGRTFVVDFAHNSMSFAKIASVFAGEKGRKIFVFGSVGEHARGRRRELAAAAERLADYSVITEDDPGWEPGICICAQIYAAFSDKRRACVIPDRREAIRHAVRLSRGGDVVFLLGKGGERYQRRCGERIPFSDTEVLLAIDKEAGIW